MFYINVYLQLTCLWTSYNCMCLNVYLYMYLELWIAWSFAQRHSARAALCWDITEAGGILVLVLHLTPCTRTGCRAEQLGSSFMKKSQGFLAGAPRWPWTSSVLLRPTASGAALGRALPAGQGLLCRAVSTSGLLSSWHECSAGRATTIMKCLEHLLNEERLSKLGLYSLEKRKFWGFSLCVNTWWKGVKEVDRLLGIVSDRARRSASDWSNIKPPLFDYTVRVVRYQNRLSTVEMECPPLVMFRTWIYVALGNLV